MFHQLPRYALTLMVTWSFGWPRNSLEHRFLLHVFFIVGWTCSPPYFFCFLCVFYVFFMCFFGSPPYFFLVVERCSIRFTLLKSKTKKNTKLLRRIPEFEVDIPKSVFHKNFPWIPVWLKIPRLGSIGWLRLLLGISRGSPFEMRAVMSCLKIFSGLLNETPMTTLLVH